MRLSDVDGQIADELDEFCKDCGHPQGKSFTFEVTGKVVFELSSEDLVCTRKAH